MTAPSPASSVKRNSTAAANPVWHARFMSSHRPLVDEDLFADVVVPVGRVPVGAEVADRLTIPITAAYPPVHDPGIWIQNGQDFFSRCTARLTDLGNDSGDHAGCLLLGDSCLLFRSHFVQRRSRARRDRGVAGIVGYGVGDRGAGGA